MSRCRRPLRMAGIAVASMALVGVVLAPASATAADDPPPGGETPAAESGSLLLLLDASGSMREDAGSGTRLSAAKAAVTRVVDALPDDAVAGLRVYGATISDGPGSCRDTQLVVPVGTLDRAGLKAATKRVRALGNTPIAYSLEQAANDLPDEGPRTIVLVSDGEESCGGDPCEVAERVADEGVDVRIDTVGFQVDANARSQLTCVAKAGRGTYYDAPDAASLGSQLRRLSVRAARAYRPAGTPVTGTPTPQGAPQVRDGQYLDTIGGTAAVRHYAFPYTEGQTVHLAATVRPTTAARSDNFRVNLSVLAPDGAQCATGTQFTVGQGSVPVSTSVRLPETVNQPAPGCTADGTYTLAVEYDGSDADELRPLEVVVRTEDPVASTAGLPQPSAADEEAAGTATGPAQETQGSASLNDAPRLQEGVYSDTILPNESLFYAVDLDWGQQLVCDVTWEPSPPFVAQRINSAAVGQVSTAVWGPTRASLSTGAPATAGTYSGTDTARTRSASPEVRYLNRTSSAVAGASIPGPYYCGIVMFTGTFLRGAAEVPVTVQLSVLGSAGEGAPTYTSTAATTEPSASASESEPTQAPDDSTASDADDGGSGSAVPLVIGAVVLLLAGAAVALWVRRRRGSEPTG